MAKRKRRKNEKKKMDYSIELYGVALILFAVLGLGRYGPVGRFITSFAIFLVGSLYMVLLLVFFIIGAYMIIKRERPNYKNSKLIGIYIFTLGFLILMHKEFVNQNEGNFVLIFKETINQLVTSFNSVMKTGSMSDLFQVGGGMIGCFFASSFDKLFSYTGMQIVSWTFIVLGFVLFTGFSIVDFLKDKVSNRKNTDKNNVIISDGNEELVTSLKDDNKHIKISSIDELTKVEGKNSPEPSEYSSDTLKDYKLPSIDILDKPKARNKSLDQSIIEKNIMTLEKVLSDFKISGKVVEVHVGPTVVQYELEIASGTRVNRITAINREISLALAKKDVRIEAPIPGKNTVGIEFANDTPTPVSFYEIISSKQMMSAMDKKLMVPLGKSIMGDIGVCEINKMPHLLIAGTTGNGKSVCVNGIICSILMRAKPDEVKLVMVDPKVVELSVYNGVPHLMRPVVTDPRQAAIALNKMVQEMERRYTVFSDSKTKNIESYNNYVLKYNKNKPDSEKKANMPYIVIIID